MERSAKQRKARTGKAVAGGRSRQGRPRTNQRWSQGVTETSDALDLMPHIFESASPRAIAQSLKRSAEQSTRRKSSPYRSAMSMLTFYINRAGKTLSQSRRSILERAKGELRKAFGRA